MISSDLLGQTAREVFAALGKEEKENRPWKQGQSTGWRNGNTRDTSTRAELFALLPFSFQSSMLRFPIRL